MRVVLLAFTALLASPAAAQQAAPASPPGKPDPKLVTAGSYNLEPRHSQILFTVNHQGFTEYSGMFTMPTGTLAIDPKNLSATKVEITIPIGQVKTTVTALDTHLKTADFFDVAQFPEARFVSTSVVAHGTHATITGNLTMHGVTRPVKLDARFVGAGPTGRDHKTTVGFAATAHVKRSDFGMTYLVPIITDQVDLTINAAFVAQ
jgi:polyisoprenoid-binding protein YceI